MQNHPEQTRLFIINLHEKQVNLVGVTFKLYIDAIVNATGIPSVGDKWFKQDNLDMCYFEPHLNPRYKDHNK